MHAFRLNRNSWNQKNLDYEIETWYEAGESADSLILEIKRTSITRLKLGQDQALA